MFLNSVRGCNARVVLMLKGADQTSFFKGLADLGFQVCMDLSQDLGVGIGAIFQGIRISVFKG